MDPKSRSFKIVYFAVSFLVLAVVSFAPVAVARADIRVREDPIRAALHVAYRYWHIRPCAGRLHVYTARPPFLNDESVLSGGQVSMLTSWDAGMPTENDESAPQPFSACSITINADVWHSAGWEAYGAWPEFAVGIVHEVGHLLGHGHSADPASVMFPEPSARIALTGETAPGWG